MMVEKYTAPKWLSVYCWFWLLMPAVGFITMIFSYSLGWLLVLSGFIGIVSGAALASQYEYTTQEDTHNDDT